MRLAAAGIALYAMLALLLWPSLSAPPSTLDDASTLQRAAVESISEIWRHDHFGHYRPLKKLFFWGMARTQDQLGLWRLGVLAAFLGTVALVRRLAEGVLGSPWLALAVAACWGLNPLTLGVVAWLSASHLVLALLCMLAYFHCGERVFESSEPRKARWWMTAALCVLSVALLFHQLALLAPLLLIAYGRVRALARSRWTHPLYLASGVLLVAYVVLQSIVERPPVAYRFEQTPAWLLSASAARYVLQNLAIWLWPRGGYGVLLVDRPEAHLVASGLAWLFAACAGAYAYRRRHAFPGIVFGLSWTAVLLVPVSNLLPLGNTPLAVHYMYMPGVGFALALVHGFTFAVRYAASTVRKQQVAAALLVALVAAFWLPDARRIVAAWSDTEPLLLLTHENHPDNVEVLVNLSALYLDRKDFGQAEVFLRRAKALAPGDIVVVRNSYSLLWQTEQYQAALDLLDEHEHLAQLPEFLVRRGELLEALERYGDAAAAFERGYAATDRERSAELRYFAGMRLIGAWTRLGKTVEAQKLATRLAAEFPDKEELTAIARMLRQANTDR